MTPTTRGTRGLSYTLITPDNHYPSRWPAFGDATVVKLVTPRLAPSRITQALVLLEPGGGTVRPVPAGQETFLYGVQGEAVLAAEGTELSLAAGAWAYLPASAPFEVSAADPGAALLLLRRDYEPTPGHEPPGLRGGHREDEPFAATAVPGFTRRELLPVADPAFDLAMSLLRFEAGVGLANVEIHDEEHGLYVLEGAGTYRLEEREHAVQAGDFVYMAPFCPQGFVNGPGGPAEYLLYKDAWR